MHAPDYVSVLAHDLYDIRNTRIDRVVGTQPLRQLSLVALGSLTKSAPSYRNTLRKYWVNNNPAGPAPHINTLRTRRSGVSALIS